MSAWAATWAAYSTTTMMTTMTTTRKTANQRGRDEGDEGDRMREMENNNCATGRQQTLKQALPTLPAVDIIHIDSRKIVSYFFSFSVLNV
jgi:hypothetical protein